MMNANNYYLVPKFDSRKSFYNKARIEVSGGWGQTVTLYSYETPVARVGYIEDANDARLDAGEFCAILFDEWDYSPTTLRHVREFLAQYGFGYYNHKADIVADCIEYNGHPVIIRP